MTKQETLRKMREMGLMEARALQTDAAGNVITETQIIGREEAAPRFDPSKDYSGWPARSPVRDGGQVWLLLIPHNAAHYTGRPADLRALWGLAHTTDPEKAKAWVAPYGTSGLYQRGECCKVDGVVYRSTEDDNPYSPTDYPAWWEKVEVI